MERNTDVVDENTATAATNSTAQENTAAPAASINTSTTSANDVEFEEIDDAGAEDRNSDDEANLEEDEKGTGSEVDNEDAESIDLEGHKDDEDAKSVSAQDDQELETGDLSFALGDDQGNESFLTESGRESDGEDTQPGLVLVQTGNNLDAYFTRDLNNFKQGNEATYESEWTVSDTFQENQRIGFSINDTSLLMDTEQANSFEISYGAEALKIALSAEANFISIYNAVTDTLTIDGVPLAQVQQAAAEAAEMLKGETESIEDAQSPDEDHPIITVVEHDGVDSGLHTELNKADVSPELGSNTAAPGSAVEAPASPNAAQSAVPSVTSTPEAKASAVSTVSTPLVLDNTTTPGSAVAEGSNQASPAHAQSAAASTVSTPLVHDNTATPGSTVAEANNQASPTAAQSAASSVTSTPETNTTAAGSKSPESNPIITVEPHKDSTPEKPSTAKESVDNASSSKTSETTAPADKKDKVATLVSLMLPNAEAKTSKLFAYKSTVDIAAARKNLTAALTQFSSEIDKADDAQLETFAKAAIRALADVNLKKGASKGASFIANRGTNSLSSAVQSLADFLKSLWQALQTGSTDPLKDWWNKNPRMVVSDADKFDKFVNDVAKGEAQTATEDEKLKAKQQLSSAFTAATISVGS